MSEPMTAARLIRVLLELDQQCITHRPSGWGNAAEIVYELCTHAKLCPHPHRNMSDDLGDFEAVDLSQVYRPAPSELSQPVLDAMSEPNQLRDQNAKLLAACEAIQEAHKKMCYIPESNMYKAHCMVRAAIKSAKGGTT